MNTNKKIDQQISQFRKLNHEADAIEKKLNELEALLNSSELDSEKIKSYKSRIDNTLDKKLSLHEKLNAYQSLDKEDNLSQNDRLDKLMTLLSDLPVDSNAPKQLKKNSLPQKIVLCIIALVIITLGFAMIILPAPPDFEMFTIFYFNENDGVTIMDLISLIIVFAGTFLLISTIRKKERKDV